jgi:hypothetical protein
MTNDDFVEAVERIVADSAVRSATALLEGAPGVAPSDVVADISRWYSGLGSADKDRLLQVVRYAIDQSVFGFLCVLDGVRAIEANPNKGALELHYVSSGGRVRLNDPKGEFLHDLFNPSL